MKKQIVLALISAITSVSLQGANVIFNNKTPFAFTVTHISKNPKKSTLPAQSRVIVYTEEGRCTDNVQRPWLFLVHDNTKTLHGDAHFMTPTGCLDKDHLLTIQGNSLEKITVQESNK